MSEFKPIPLTETQMAELFRLHQRVAELEQQLIEVRRAERERVAQYVQQGTGDWMLGKKIAAAIRAME